MILRLLLLALLAYVVWQLWRRALSRRAPPPQPPGFSADPEALVRCDRCGVRLPASQVDAVRKNCRQCGDGNREG